MTSVSFLPCRSDKDISPTGYARYQSDVAVSQYCDAHYGPDKFGVANFSATLARLCISELNHLSQCRALDLGCAVGRSAFELATCFDQVDAVDFSSRFIDIARRIQKSGWVHYRLIEEGNLISDRKMSLADLGLKESADKVCFSQGNAQDLEPRCRDYQLVLAANLVDRLTSPGRFLSEIHQQLVPGGLLVIASPYDWLEKFTPQKQWLGGRYRTGRPLDSLSGLEEKLGRHFALCREPRELEFVIHKTGRTFNHSISQVTFWQRHG
ncbi:MAG: putative 4-mercaptohistidine N1-methyltransferase [Desulfuromonas sp.]|nr:MAG: putative 4-mercaptohistidine N1-methyltransferase [Desulfuromonas sp.]